MDFKAINVKDYDWGTMAMCLAVISLPWSIRFNSYSLIVLCATAIVSRASFQQKWSLVKTDNLLVILFIIYFILHVVAISYSQNAHAGFKALEKKLAFLLVPSSIWILMKEKKTRDLLLRCFLLSVLAAALVCLLLGVKNNIDENVKNNFSLFSINKWFYTYRLLSGNIDIHPSYLSCYGAFAVIYLLKRVLFHDTFSINKESFALIFLLVFITLLAARNIMITTLAFVIGSILYTMWKFRTRGLIVFSITILLCMVGALAINDVIFDRLINVLDDRNQASNWGSLSLRLQEWEASFILIKDNIWFGVSPANATDELVSVYNAKGWFSLAKEAFNSHNQFIETLLSLGIAGLSILLGIYYISFRRAIQNRDFVYFCFLVLFGTFSITESTLEVQKGIVFFVLFNSICYHSSTRGDLVK